jgi:hypothetical protein
VEESYGKGFSADIRTADGALQRQVCDPGTVKAHVRACYENCFGADIAAAFGDLPCFNAGVFALRAHSPSWKVWQDIYAPALARQFHFMAEQQALNIAIRQGRIAVAPQPQEANYTCHLELPWYSAQKGVFTMPGAQERVLGIVHLCDTKNFALLPIPQFPQGQPRAMPLDYRSVQRFIAQPQGDQSSNLARNTPCPCGSGRKYKHCHGQIV